MRAAQNRCTIRFRLTLAAATCALGLAVLPGAAAQAASRPLETALTDGGPFIVQPEVAFSRVFAAGARSVRIYVAWNAIAPSGEKEPAGFQPRNPADPNYDWSVLDRQVRAAEAAGVSPILAISKAPLWAETVKSNFRPGTNWPSARKFADFTTAAARRYSGRFFDLPRVQRWQAWNEPNLYSHLQPQYDTPIAENVTTRSRPMSPEVYRPMLNAFATAVHAVHADNVVIAGALAPFGRYRARDHGVAPLQFMRQLLCLSRRNRPLRGCDKRASFDVWSTHPYTQGGPTTSAENPDNVSLGDLPEVRRVLLAGRRTGHIRTKQSGVGFWVTEISWDTSPPDPGGVPLKLHARWVSEALYRMWQNGVTLATWFQLRDEDAPHKPKSREFTSGLYFRCEQGLYCDRPKLSLRAFRFPFVAFRNGRKIRMWGRTPGGTPGTVVVQQLSNRRWRKVVELNTDRYGIFRRTVTRRRRGPLRAVGADDRSVQFSLKRPPNLRVNPFGGCEGAEAERPACPSS